MSAIMLSLVNIATMVVSFGILLYLVSLKKFKGFDAVALVIVLVLFLSTAASSTMLGAYGFNTIRNGGNNGSGLSLYRD